eukprot:Selendium_serpulae@DN6191_c2_g1_i1.p1
MSVGKNGKTGNEEGGSKVADGHHSLSSTCGSVEANKAVATSTAPRKGREIPVLKAAATHLEENKQRQRSDKQRQSGSSISSSISSSSSLSASSTNRRRGTPTSAVDDDCFADQCSGVGIGDPASTIGDQASRSNHKEGEVNRGRPKTRPAKLVKSTINMLQKKTRRSKRTAD